jgi:regulator of protease activity HflC (stomatin/prohibitin superfamily)
MEAAVRRVLIIFVVIIVLLGLATIFMTPHFYVLARVNADEVGVQLSGGRIKDVVPPGIYSDVGLFVSISTYSTQAYQFQVADQEVLTQDNQRIGVTVTGSLFRPGPADSELIKSLWTKYRLVYSDNNALQKVISDLTLQAVKVCVGDRPFKDSVIGSERDSLRTCIDKELNGLVKTYGLSVANVTVPNVVLSPEVQSLLDQITKSRLETEKAEQDRLKALAQGTAEQAKQEAEIRVAQSRIQEETKQQTTLAKLNEEKLKAQMAVITAQKENDLLSAQKDLEINKAMAAASLEKAKSELAKETALAEIYRLNAGYLQIQMAMLNASALKATDKIIFTPEGVMPNLIFGNNILPTVPITQPTAQPTAQPTTPPATNK